MYELMTYLCSAISVVCFGVALAFFLQGYGEIKHFSRNANEKTLLKDIFSSNIFISLVILISFFAFSQILSMVYLLSCDTGISWVLFISIGETILRFIFLVLLGACLILIKLGFKNNNSKMLYISSVLFIVDIALISASCCIHNINGLDEISANVIGVLVLIQFGLQIAAVVLMGKKLHLFKNYFNDESSTINISKPFIILSGISMLLLIIETIFNSMSTVLLEKLGSLNICYSINVILISIIIFVIMMMLFNVNKITKKEEENKE